MRISIYGLKTLYFDKCPYTLEGLHGNQPGFRKIICKRRRQYVSNPREDARMSKQEDNAKYLQKKEKRDNAKRFFFYKKKQTVVYTSCRVPLLRRKSNITDELR